MFKALPAWCFLAQTARQGVGKCVDFSCEFGGNLAMSGKRSSKMALRHEAMPLVYPKRHLNIQQEAPFLNNVKRGCSFESARTLSNTSCRPYDHIPHNRMNVRTMIRRSSAKLRSRTYFRSRANFAGMITSV